MLIAGRCVLRLPRCFARRATLPQCSSLPPRQPQQRVSGAALRAFLPRWQDPAPSPDAAEPPAEHHHASRLDGVLHISPGGLWRVPFAWPTTLFVAFCWANGFLLLAKVVVPRLASLLGFATAAEATGVAAAALALASDACAALFCVGLLAALRRRFSLQPPWLTAGRLSWRMLRDVALCCAAFPAVAALASLCSASAGAPPELPGGADASAATHACYIALVGFVAPLWEEALFRGFVLPSLTRYASAPVSIVLSSALFAAAHGSAERAPPLALLGLLLGALCCRCGGGLAAPVVVHGAWNLFAYLEALWWT